MRRLLRVLPLAACITQLACTAIVGDYEVGTQSIDTSRLCDIERATFAFPIDTASTSQQPDVETYYELANPELTTHLSATAKAFSAGTAHAGVTYVMGTTGVGKSFALRNVVDGFATTERCDINLNDIFASPVGFSVVPAPDLVTLDGKVTFNELPSLADAAAFKVSSLFTAANCSSGGTLAPLIVVDGLDQIHGAAATTILKEIDQFILDGANGAGPFIHFVAAGCPEAFNGWLTNPNRTEKNNAILERFTLAAPHYQTAGDIELRVRGYLQFTGQLTALEASGELAAYVGRVINAVAANPFLTYSLGNLAVGNIIIERTGPKTGETEETLKIGLLDDILDRAAQAYNRPDPGVGLGGPYLRALEEIAVRYINVDNAGVFEVLSEDVVEMRDDAGKVLGSVRVRDVLDRSGLALLTSAVAAGTRYRFDPFWIHAHLVERYNQRIVPGYTYKTCE